MIKIEKYSDKYKEELYKFVFDIMIKDVGKEPIKLKQELIDLENVNSYYKENFWIALDEENRIVGSIGLVIEKCKGQVKRVYIESRYRHSGIGTLLYEKLEKTAKANNISILYLSAGIELKNAHKFYEKLGYKNCGLSETGDSYVYEKNFINRR